MKKQQASSPTKKRVLAFTIVLFVAVLVALGLFEYRAHKNASLKLSKDTQSKTTSSTKTAQSNFNQGNDNRDPGNTLNENRGSAEVTDNNGVISSQTNPNDYTKSSSGEITLYSPVKNSIISTGTEISGTSTLSVVSFRIIDSVSGMISTGTIKVVSGKFSGTAQFSTTAKDGQLDIYGTRSDGSEFSNISIPVAFK